MRREKRAQARRLGPRYGFFFLFVFFILINVLYLYLGSISELTTAGIRGTPAATMKLPSWLAHRRQLTSGLQPRGIYLSSCFECFASFFIALFVLDSVFELI